MSGLHANLFSRMRCTHQLTPGGVLYGFHIRHLPNSAAVMSGPQCLSQPVEPLGLGRNSPLVTPLTVHHAYRRYRHALTPCLPAGLPATQWENHPSFAESKVSCHQGSVNWQNQQGCMTVVEVDPDRNPGRADASSIATVPPGTSHASKTTDRHVTCIGSTRCWPHSESTHKVSCLPIGSPSLDISILRLKRKAIFK